MAPVAMQLSEKYGIIESLHRAPSFEGQIEELKEIIDNHSQEPVVLVGYSYGGFLGFVFAGLYPDLVNKLILVSSGPFEARYAQGLFEKRLNRLDLEHRKRAENLIKQIDDPALDNKNEIFSLLGQLISKADSYDPISIAEDNIEASFEVYRDVWPDVQALRQNVKLLFYGETITCPVVAIHGDYDPHPMEGVSIPLSKTLLDFKMIPLENCGHHPWLEKQAKDEFYKVLDAEIQGAP